MKFSLATLAALASSVLTSAVPKESKVSYDGYKAFRISTHNQADAIKAKIASLAAVPFNLNTDEHLDVAIPPKEVQAFEALGLDTAVLTEDLGADIASEGAFGTYESSVSAQAIPSATWFNSYHAYADHITFFNDLQSAFPSNSEILSIGNSAQGRNIFGIHLWGSGGKGSKPAIYFHGNVHAREWITSKVVEYITYQFVAQYDTNSTVKSILDKYDFYILPFVNPDGFVYSQTNDRLWRKNRQSRSGQSCVGTDLNRNWPYKWELTGGASTSACAETYKGQASGDAPEMRALTAFTSTIAASKGIKLFVDWHSYGQYILLPYGYNCQARAANHNKQLSLAQGLGSRIRSVGGTSWTVGPSCSTLYMTTGSSTDYLMDVSKAELAWTIELRPSGNSGTSGFVLPAAQILPSAREQWEGLVWLLTNSSF